MEYAFELKDALDEFFTVRKRSATLFGDAPVRAVQACPPYCEGSGYGYQLSYPQLGLAVNTGPDARIEMLDELAPGFDYAAEMDTLADQGWIARDSAWFQRIGENWWWQDNADKRAFWIWTGLLIRIRPDFIVRITELFNAPQLQADIDEVLYSHRDEWQPLCIKLRLRGTSNCILRGGIASLGVLDADSHVEITPIEECLAAGQRDVDFYDPAYYEAKLTGRPTKKYARLRRNSSIPDIITESAKVLLPHQQFQHTASIVPFAVLQDDSSETPLDAHYALIRAGAAMHCQFLGRSFRAEMSQQWFELLQTVRGQWRQWYGEAGERCLYDKTQGAESAIHPTAGPPALVLNIEPFLKFAVAPGWCALFEANRQGSTHGLRGLIAADRFHSGAFALQCFDTPESFDLTAESVLGRFIPIRQATLDAEFRWIEGDRPGQEKQNF